MNTELTRVNFPYRGAIRSGELTSYLNSIIDAIEARAADLERIEDYFSNYFIYGMQVEEIGTGIDISPGGFFKNGIDTPIKELSITLENGIQEGDYVVFSIGVGDIFVTQEPFDTDVLIAKYTDGTFDYSIRSKISDALRYSSDKRRLVCVDNRAELNALKSPERIGYAFDDTSIHVYAGNALGWLPVDRYIKVIDEEHLIASPVNGQITSYSYLIPTDRRFLFKELYILLYCLSRDGRNATLNFETTDSTETVNFSNTEMQLYEIPLTDLILNPGLHTLTISGNGNITIQKLIVYGVI